MQKKPSLHLQAAIFDLDGTLVDSESQAAQAVRESCVEAGFQLPESLVTLTYGRTWESAYRLVLAQMPELARTVPNVEIWVERYRQIVSREGVREIPGAARFVRTLAEAGVPLRLVSGSGRREIEHALQSLGIRDCFAHIYGAEDYPRSKPAPDGFERALRELAVDPKHALVFEDSSAGVEAARAAGTWVVHVQAVAWDAAQTARNAQFHIQNYQGLGVEWFKELRAP